MSKELDNTAGAFCEYASAKKWQFFLVAGDGKSNAVCGGNFEDVPEPESPMPSRLSKAMEQDGRVAALIIAAAMRFIHDNGFSLMEMIAEAAAQREEDDEDDDD